MKLQILFDSNPRSLDFAVGWGFSCFIDGRILFDTGADGAALLANMNLLNIATDDIDAIVLSHGHYDHTGGLWDLIDIRSDVRIVTGKDIVGDFEEKMADRINPVQKISDWTEICPGFFCSGSMPAQYKGSPMPEQFLVVKTGKGLNIITGCAHAGIVEIVKKTKTKFPGSTISLVLGGFHLKGADAAQIEAVARSLKDLNVGAVCPLHCSGPKAPEVFEEVFGSETQNPLVGGEIEI